MREQSTEQPTDRTADRPTDAPFLESTEVAAVRLGVSRNAVLQRIKRGTLTGQKVDGVWFVVVDDQLLEHLDDRPTDQSTSRPIDRPTEHQITVNQSARSQLEAIRDEWLAPLVAQITDQAERIGRLEAERDRAIQDAETFREQAEISSISQQRAKEIEQERDDLRRRLEDQLVAMDEDEGPISIAEAESVRDLEQERDALQRRVRELEQQSAESSQPDEPTAQGQSQRPWWRFWERL